MLSKILEINERSGNMIHTAELTYPPTGELYQKFIDLPSTHYWEQEQCYANTSLSDYGITSIKAMIANKPGFRRYQFIMRANLKRLIEQDNRILVMSEDDVAAVYDAFSQYMDQIGIPDMPRITDWYAKRIDYCINIRTTYVKEYIRILNKSVIPYYCRRYYDDNRNYTTDPGSLYLVSKAKRKSRSITINFYDKYDEVRKKMDADPHVTPAVLEQAKNILRLEVQCHQAKTTRIAQSDNTDKRLYHYLSMDTFNRILEQNIWNVTKAATYQRKSIALEMIDKLPCRAPRKKLLKAIINNVARQYQSISKVREQFVKDGICGKEAFNECLRYLEKYDINAVTIPDNVHLQGKTLKEGLPSIYEIYIDALTDQNRT